MDREERICRNALVFVRSSSTILLKLMEKQKTKKKKNQCGVGNTHRRHICIVAIGLYMQAREMHVSFFKCDRISKSKIITGTCPAINMGVVQ